MKILSLILVLFFALTGSLLSFNSAHSQPLTPFTFTETDTDSVGSFSSMFYFFDLRERETFIQLTYNDSQSTGLPARAHIQIFDVSNNCNENDFFDDYTLNDTHVYNMRDIQRNDGNSSGVVLPDGSYGIVAVTIFGGVGGAPTAFANAIGNLRILDNNGYEYRTNAQKIFTSADSEGRFAYSFNFNQQAGISFSDIVGVTLDFEQGVPFIFEWLASNPLGAYNSFDVDIIDNNEVPFSCRDVIFSCINEDNPRLEELLEFAGTASVANFEYGINNAIPHSKGGELLCPGNIISEGHVILRPELQPFAEGTLFPFFFGFVGLNNGNGRGSMDSLMYEHLPLGG